MEDGIIRKGALKSAVHGTACELPHSLPSLNFHISEVTNLPCPDYTESKFQETIILPCNIGQVNGDVHAMK